MVHQHFLDFKNTRESVRKEELYSIHIKFCIPVKLVGLVKMCLDKTYVEHCPMHFLMVWNKEVS
jgi:hypothetical protein